MHPVVQLGVVLGVLQRLVQRVVVIVDAVHLVHQALALLHIVVDVDARDAQADVVLRPRIERTLVDHPELLVVVHHVGRLVVDRQVGEQAQPARSIAVVRSDLLLRHHPPAMLAAARLEVVAGQPLRLAVDVVVDVIGLRRAVVVAQPVLARQLLGADLRLPDQLHRQQRALGPAAAHLEAVAGLQVRRVLLVGADLHVPVRREVVLHPQRPLADRPVVPDAPRPVAHLRAAEGQVLEIAGEAVEVLALAETAEFHVQRAVEVLLLEPQLGQPPGLPAAPDLLHRADVPGTRVADAVVGKVLAIALGDGELELGGLPAEDRSVSCLCASLSLNGSGAGLARRGIRPGSLLPARGEAQRARTAPVCRSAQTWPLG